MPGPFRRVFITALVVLTVLALSGPAPAGEVLGVEHTPTGTGWLERDDTGILVLHLSGSYYDMGYQQGKLLPGEIRTSANAIAGQIGKAVPLMPKSVFVALANVLIYAPSSPHIPRAFKQEMRGLADAADISLFELHALHASIFIQSCSGTAAFGPATIDGRLYQTRSLDYPLDMIDPQTDTPMQENSLIVVYDPDGGVPFVSFSWPGNLASVGGMNAQGICVSEMTDSSLAEWPGGVPMMWRIKNTLANARDLGQAAGLMTERPLEGGYNFLVGDGKIPDARAVEMDAWRAYVGGWDGPAESGGYAYKGKSYSYEPLEGVLVRTNHPLDKTLIKRHTGGIDGRNRSSAPRYYDLRRRAEDNYGKLDLENIFIEMREHYRGLCEAGDDPNCQSTIYQAAFDPKTGDFIVAFAKGDPRRLGKYKVSAYDQPWHRFNLFELLDRSPTSPGG